MKFNKIFSSIVLASTTFTLIACNSGNSNQNSRSSSTLNKTTNFYAGATGPLKDLGPQISTIQNLTKVCVVNGSISNQRTATFTSGSQKIPALTLLPGEIKCTFANAQDGIVIWNDYKDGNGQSNIRYHFESAHVVTSFWQIVGMLFTQMATMMMNVAVGDELGLLISFLPADWQAQIAPFTDPAGYLEAGLISYGIMAVNSAIPSEAQEWTDMGMFVLFGALEAGSEDGEWGDWSKFAMGASKAGIEQAIDKLREKYGNFGDVAEALQQEAKQYSDDLKQNDPNNPSPAISGMLTPNNSPDKNQHIFVLGVQPTKSIGKSGNPFSWVPTASATGSGGLFNPNSCIDDLGEASEPFDAISKLLSTCSYKLQTFVLNQHSQVISQNLYDSSVEDTIGMAPSDAIYVCLTDDSNDKSKEINCSVNDLNAPLDYSDPVVDNTGAPLSGTVRVTNNTVTPLSPVLEIYSDSQASKPDSYVSGPLIPPNTSYTFEESQIPDNTVGYKIAVNTSVWLGTPNLFKIGTWNSYDKSWAQQRAVVNYNFASNENVGMLAQGPYQAYNYTQANIAESQGDLWASHAVRGWQQVRAAQALQQTSSGNASGPTIEVWVPNWKGLTYSVINDIDLRADTIMFAFVNVNSDGSVVSSNPWGDFAVQNNGGLGNGLMASLLALGKPVYLGIGGWNNADDFTAALRGAGSQAIVANILKIISAFNTDAGSMGVSQQISGINLDWEPNNGRWTVGDQSSSATISYTDLQTFMGLVDQLNTAGIKVSISVPQNIAVLQNVDDTWKKGGNTDGFWKTLANKTLGVKPMTYDYHAAIWNGEDNKAGYTNFNSPLHFSGNQADQANFASFNIESSMNYFLNDGISASKLTMGQATYGYAFPATQGNYGAYIPFDNNRINDMIGLEILNSSIISYKAIYYNMISDKAWFDIHNKSNWAIDPDAQEAYTQAGLAGSKGNIWTSFENHDTAMSHMQFAKSKNFAAIMVWEIDQDLPAMMSNVKNPNPDSIMSGLVDGRN